MKLSELLQQAGLKEFMDGIKDCEVTGIGADSRKVKAGDIYIAEKGAKFDGNDFIEDAVSKGAVAVVSSHEDPVCRIPDNVTYISIKDLNVGVNALIRGFYGNPSETVRTIGITGTNGKTTVSYLIESILGVTASLSVIGTVNYRLGQKVLPAVNTTPGKFDNQKLLSQFAREGVEYCVMEVSSHALYQGRVSLIDFSTAVFTNLTKDHLDYHTSMEDYFSAKAILFTTLKEDAWAVINADDAYGRKLFSKTQAQIMTYGLENKAEVYVEDIQMDLSGTRFKLITPQGAIPMRTKLVGRYNIYNILAAASACLTQGAGLDQIQAGVERLSDVPGRLERVECGQEFTVFIDYAHTPDALENVLTMLKSTSDSKIITVFGCGGDRDPGKRAEMGKISCRLSDVSVVTSDNPRSEDPQKIIDAIIEGFDSDNYEVVVNRAEAIGRALAMAKPGDIVLVAGKGHETYQLFDGSSIPFDEKAIIREHFYANN